MCKVRENGPKASRFSFSLINGLYYYNNDCRSCNHITIGHLSFTAVWFSVISPACPCRDLLCPETS